MKKAVVSIFLAASLLMSLFMGVACKENDSSSGESSTAQSNSAVELTDSGESTVDSSAEDSSAEILGTPIEYTMLPFNGHIGSWKTVPPPQIVTTMEEVLALEEGFVWGKERLSNGLSADYFQEKAIVIYFYQRPYMGYKDEVQSVLLEENKLLIDFKETPSNTLDCAVDAIVLCIEIDKAYVEQIEKIAFYKNGELVKESQI